MLTWPFNAHLVSFDIPTRTDNVSQVHMLPNALICHGMSVQRRAERSSTSRTCPKTANRKERLI